MTGSAAVSGNFVSSYNAASSRAGATVTVPDGKTVIVITSATASFNVVFDSSATPSAGQLVFAILPIALVAGALAFLIFNFPPAKIFLGDSGSIPVGFLAGALGFMGWCNELWPAWLPVLVFSPFIVDATVTLLRRLLRRDRFWEPHREHAYQRLVRMGWSHGRLLRAETVLMASCAFAAVTLLEAGDPAACFGQAQ